MPIENTTLLPEFTEVQIGNSKFQVYSYYNEAEESLVEKIKHLLKMKISEDK